MTELKNLLIVAGMGTKSGKTSFICRVIREFPLHMITAVKITPHIHEITPGLKLIERGSSYAVFEETDRESRKDTSRMLRAGAGKVLYAMTSDDQLPVVFGKILEHIPHDRPVICESPALRLFAEPGAFVVMTSESIDKHKDINHLLNLPHIMLKLEEIESVKVLPVCFKDGGWFYTPAS